VKFSASCGEGKSSDSPDRHSELFAQA
jgi:hypothetical protein